MRHKAVEVCPVVHSERSKYKVPSTEAFYLSILHSQFIMPLNASNSAILSGIYIIAVQILATVYVCSVMPSMSVAHGISFSIVRGPLAANSA